MVKKILILLGIVVIIGGGTIYYMWNKPRATPKDGIKITAVDLVKEYVANDTLSNKKYLGKSLEITGEVDEIDKANGLNVILRTSDPNYAVLCNMTDSTVTLTKSQKVTIVGFCSGSNMLGVSCTECSIKK